MARRCRWLLAFAALAGASPARADSPTPPVSYTQVAPGGKYVFVMISPDAVEDEARHWNQAAADRVREVRRAYPCSGMYRNDGTADPLWTVDWYAHGVEVAPDGIHVVRHGPWASSADQEALSFFADGKLLRTHLIRDLVDNPLLMDRSVSHFLWQEDGRFDPARLEYALTTKDRNRFVFDVRTGAVVSESRPARIIVGIAAALGVAVLALLVWRRRTRSRAAGSGPGPARPAAPD